MHKLLTTVFYFSFVNYFSSEHILTHFPTVYIVTRYTHLEGSNSCQENYSSLKIETIHGTVSPGCIHNLNDQPVTHKKSLPLSFPLLPHTPQIFIK